MSAEKMTDQALEYLLKKAGDGYCDAIASYIYEHAKGRLRGEDKALVEEHLAECQECAELYEEFSQWLKEQEANDRPLSELAAEVGKAVLNKLWDMLRPSPTPMLELAIPHGFRSRAGGRDVCADEPEPPRNAVFEPGDEVDIFYEPKRAGWLVMLLQDSQGGISLLYPKTSDQVQPVAKDDLKLLSIIATEPLGVFTVKGILTDKKLFAFSKEDFESEQSLADAMENFVKALIELPKDDYFVEVSIFEVVGNNSGSVA